MEGSPAPREVTVELPLFPLPTVLYPGIPLPLHVFEERYKQMFARVLGDDRRFGVVAVAEGAEVGGHHSYQRIGCLAEVRNARPYPDGRMDVLCQGVSRFEVTGVTQPSPYVVAEVAALPERAGGGAGAEAVRARWLFARYVSLLLRLAGEETEQIEVPDEPLAASYLVAAGLQVDLADKQRLLAAGSGAERLRAASALLRRELALLERLQTTGPAPMTGPFSLN
jgi:Lon protease-like protein